MVGGRGKGDGWDEGFEMVWYGGGRLKGGKVDGRGKEDENQRIQGDHYPGQDL